MLLFQARLPRKAASHAAVAELAEVVAHGAIDGPADQPRALARRLLRGGAQASPSAPCILLVSRNREHKGLHRRVIAACVFIVYASCHEHAR
jgi:hypothetical protein